MLDFLRILLGIFFVPSTIYFGAKGLWFRPSEAFEKETHKRIAIYRTASIFCGLVSFEVFYPTIDALICLPLVLFIIWMNYFIAVAQINSMKE